MADETVVALVAVLLSATTVTAAVVARGLAVVTVGVAFLTDVVVVTRLPAATLGFGEVAAVADVEIELARPKEY